MADGVVKIVLRSIAEGSGFAETVRDVNKAMGGVGDLSKALQTMGKIAGTTGGLFGSMLGNLVKGGFWGVAAEGVRLVVGKIEEWRESARKAREEQVRLVKESTESLIAGIEKVSAARAGLAAAEGARMSATGGARDAAIDLKAANDAASAKGDAAVIRAKAELEKATLGAADRQKAAARAVELAEAEVKDLREIVYQRNQLYIRGQGTLEQQTEAENKLLVAEQKLAKAKEDALAAEARGRLGVVKAQQAQAEALAENAKALAENAERVRAANAKMQKDERALDADIGFEKRRLGLAKSGDAYSQALLRREKLVGDAMREEAEAKDALSALKDKLKAQAKVVEEQMLAGKDATAANEEWVRLSQEEVLQRKKVQLAERRRQSVEAEQNAAVEAALKAEDRKRVEKLRKAEVAALEERIERAQAELPVLDRALAAQKILADAWEKNAQKARGKDFSVWLGETEAEEKAAADERRRFGRANAGAARRAQSIRNRGFWASARDKSWLARYDEWKSAQDPSNNAAAARVETLEKERAEKVASIAKVADEIKALLSKAVTME